MARPKGSPKLGGRKKGTPNKVTNEIRKQVQAVLSEQLQPEIINDIINNLEYRDKADFIVKLLQYAVPKPAPVDSNTGKTVEGVSIPVTTFLSDGNN